MKLNNKYYILRHGQALSNVKDIMSCWPEKGRFPITQKGKKQIKTVIKKLKNQGIDLIFSSDLLRTKQTSEIISRALKIKPKYDKRLREHNVGVFNIRPIKELRNFLPPKGEKRFSAKFEKGETYNELQKRMYDFLKDINKKYKDKNILIISHELPLSLLEMKVKGISNKDFYQKKNQDKRLNTGELRKLCN